MRAILLATGVVAVAFLAGCASDPPADQQTTTSNAPAGHGSLAQCLADHGVPAAPGPAAAPPPGVDPDTWHQAMQACASFAPGPTG
ncbi:hypothetical protein [Mycolicibacterium celeriflavum]|uniref:Uncharacterized protein n=1 Tax=Mycolicibacterium celeriflavum TaxID=1249101 RepID=A0A1X0BJQ6_MYCCF|nr:hypothetical protein [Mycolicibacterium celeriflavum]MCV7241056.1 hypothetical protein [Mycolicibacterium celeriflavum]ORA42689.1 hypothetical protein BST21_23090 [Mycolicibacterium celeriflavum]BBY45678.1 hypothetical protein MCEL_39730 [Mycolicibacterium celeriflavum]